jgi:hypothetical protein
MNFDGLGRLVPQYIGLGQVSAGNRVLEHMEVGRRVQQARRWACVERPACFLQLGLGKGKVGSVTLSSVLPRRSGQLCHLVTRDFTM